MPKSRYEIEGKCWLPISRAAELLGTNAQGVRKMMGDGSLDWRQTRANSRTFVVDEQTVMALSKEIRPVPKKPSAGAPTRSFEPVRRERSDAWTAHHLRSTLAPSEAKKPKE